MPFMPFFWMRALGDLDGPTVHTQEMCSKASVIPKQEAYRNQRMCLSTMAKNHTRGCTVCLLNVPSFEEGFLRLTISSSLVLAVRLACVLFLLPLYL